MFSHYILYYIYVNKNGTPNLQEGCRGGSLPSAGKLRHMIREDCRAALGLFLEKMGQ